MRFSYCCWLLVWWVSPVGLPAQHSLFNGVAFEHEVTPRYGYEIEVEHRQLLDRGDENRLLLLFAVNRKWGEHTDVAPGIRLTPRYDPEAPSELRLFTDVNVSRPLGESRLTLEGRLRVQYERRLSGPVLPEVAIRPRVGVVYRLLEFTSLVGEYEPRYRFDRRREWVRLRYTLGVSQQLSTRVTVESFYRLEGRINQSEPRTDPTIGVYVSYVLPDRRDRDWRYRRPFGRSLLW